MPASSSSVAEKMPDAPEVTEEKKVSISTPR
jgi:hypothetical protein